jgi:hypothetical protein
MEFNNDAPLAPKALAAVDTHLGTYKKQMLIDLLVSNLADDYLQTLEHNPKLSFLRFTQGKVWEFYNRRKRG